MSHQLDENREIVVSSFREELLKARRSIDERFLPLSLEVKCIRKDYTSFCVGAAGQNFLYFSVRLLVHPTVKINQKMEKILLKWNFKLKLSRAWKLFCWNVCKRLNNKCFVCFKNCSNLWKFIETFVTVKFSMLNIFRKCC